MIKKPIYVILDEQRGIDEEYEKALDGYLNKDYVLEKSIENGKIV